MHGVRIGSTRQRFGRFTELGVNPTESPLVKKYARSICLMAKAKILAVSDDQWTVGNDAICRRPLLLIDAALFGGRDNDLMFPAAATAIVTTPVLQYWKNDARPSHRKLEFLN